MNIASDTCPACGGDLKSSEHHCAAGAVTGAVQTTALSADQKKLLEIWRENRKTDSDLKKQESAKGWWKKFF